jgi:hypothetical protein
MMIEEDNEATVTEVFGTEAKVQVAGKQINMKDTSQHIDTRFLIFAFVDSQAILALQAELKSLRMRVSDNEARLDVVDNNVTVLAHDVKSNRKQDFYTFADQSERLDFTSNLARVGCVLLTGINC